MLINNIHSAELNSSIQKIRARVEVHKGSTLEKICNCGEALSEFTVERVGENKFFGFGICQKLKVNFFNENDALALTKDHFLEAAFGVGTDFLYAFPKFFIEDVSKDEETNDLTVTAYDGLYRATNYRVSDLTLPDSYTIEICAFACAALLGFPLKIENVNDNSFQTTFPKGANFDGNETIREMLDAIAEATQTIYFINNNWELTFKRLDKSGDSIYTINRNNYFEFYSRGNRTLGKVMHYTELGDNVESDEPSTVAEGVTQYIRNNPFWTLRDDIGTLVDNAQAAIGGLSIEQFECNWFGNYLVEIGDKINIVGKDNKTFTTFLLNDSITFDGAIEQNTEWTYEENDAETAANPTSLGEALSQTYARVDKASKTITLLVNDVNAVKSSTDNEIQTIKEKQTTFTQTAEDIAIRVESIETTGATKVKTGTGFTFDEEGLRINKDGSGVENLIDNTGMYVKQDGAEVLSANKDGVKTWNLNATGYLWIGSHSRFEDYEGGRTGCFWIS